MHDAERTVPFELQPTLRGRLLELRPLAAGDFEALHRAGRDPLIWEQHPESNRHEPEAFRRYFDGPNPFHSGTAFRCEWPGGGPGILAIHAASGALVRRFPLSAPSAHVAWDGLDEVGRSVPAGVYFVRLEAAGHRLTERVVRGR